MTDKTDNELMPSDTLETTLHGVKQFIPRAVFRFFQPAYHFVLAFFGMLYYKYPARMLTVIAVTGTKGKSTTVELIAHLLRTAGFTVASCSTVRFTIGEASERNLYKMTLPGRFFLQRFLTRALAAKCTHAVLEITSESTRQFRHKWLALDALIFTNISPEHIESHGSYENYLVAKLAIADALERSRKQERYLIVNADDKESVRFLTRSVPHKLKYSLDDAKPFLLESSHTQMTLFGKPITLPIPGEFNIANALAAAEAAQAFGVSQEVILAALQDFPGVPGRLERITIPEHQFPFALIVDYAHTADSLEKLYRTFAKERKICVLGNTGGGRDKWKRPLMGGIAGYYCDEIILTNEDPYDEDPGAIVEEMAAGIKKKAYKVIMDRREAIKSALACAGAGDVVIISGKGTDPYIMGPNGVKEPWDDATVVREELHRLANNGI